MISILFALSRSPYLVLGIAVLPHRDASPIYSLIIIIVLFFYCNKFRGEKFLAVNFSPSVNFVAEGNGINDLNFDLCREATEWLIL